MKTSFSHMIFLVSLIIYFSFSVPTLLISF